jgi:hypothetical protein
MGILFSSIPIAVYLAAGWLTLRRSADDSSRKSKLDAMIGVCFGRITIALALIVAGVGCSSSGDSVAFTAATVFRGGRIQQRLAGLDEEGRAMVIWGDPSGSVYTSRRYLPGVGWQEPEAVPLVSTSYEWVMTRDGRVYAIQREIDRFRLFEHDDTGWHELEPFMQPLNSDAILHVSANGDIFTAWSESTGSPNSVTLFAAFSRPGNGWSQPVELAFPALDQPLAAPVSLALSENGRAFMLWKHADGQATQRRVVSVSMTGWGSVKTLDPVEPGYNFQSIYATADGHALAAWISMNSVKTAWFDPSSDSWGSPQMSPVASYTIPKIILSKANTALSLWKQIDPDYVTFDFQRLYASVNDPATGWLDLGKLSIDLRGQEVAVDDMTAVLDATGKSRLLAVSDRSRLYVGRNAITGIAGQWTLVEDVEQLLTTEHVTVGQNSSYGIPQGLTLAMNSSGSALLTWYVLGGAPELLRAAVIEK